MYELPVPVNPSTIFAHALYEQLRQARIINLYKNKFHAKYKCVRCRGRGNHKFYNTKEMYHIWKYRNKGQARQKYWEHYCQECGDFYLDNNNVPEERIIRPEN
jgi:hypothetical protein